MSSVGGKYLRFYLDVRPLLTNTSQNEAKYDPAMRRSEQQEIEWLINRINLPVLTARASFLRDGIPCTVPPLTYDRASFQLLGISSPAAEP